MKDTCEKEAYFSQNKITVTGSENDLNTWIYRLEDTGVYVRETIIDSGMNDGNIVEIVQLSDLHFNFTNAEDELNEEVMYTKKCRKWNADGATVPAVQKAMKYASYFDQTMITGDTLDYLSYGALELTQKHIWDVDPGALICLGGHDVTRQMETGLKDKTTLEERQKVLKGKWKHDIFYTSRVIKNKVMVIQLDNGCGFYTKSQVEKLEMDIKIAREKKYIILIFQHEPLCTGKPEDVKVKAFKVYDKEYQNFYDGCIGYNLTEATPTKDAYKLITQNADIVLGVFCGHYHSAFYTEIKGSYTDNQNVKHTKYIPQHVVTPSAYDDYAGQVMKITVK